MHDDGVPIIRITHLDTGQQLTLDPAAADSLRANLGVALDHFRDQDAFLRAAAAGSVLHGGGMTIPNEHGQLWLDYGAEGELLPPPDGIPPV